MKQYIVPPLFHGTLIACLLAGGNWAAFAIGAVWFLVALLFVTCAVAKIARKGWLHRVLGWLYMGALIVALVHTGHPLAGLFYLLGHLFCWAGQAVNKGKAQ